MLIHCNFYSDCLIHNTDINVIIPSPVMRDESGRDYFAPELRYPVLYLLHGAGGDYSDWVRQTGIERYAQEKGIAVVMPCAEGSYYHDMAAGGRFFTFISQELPKHIKKIFPVSERREDTFIAGLSMGGYGAFKIALSLPENYSCAASLSGPMDLEGSFDRMMKNISPMTAEHIVKDPLHIKGTESDLLELYKRAGKRADKVKLYQACGTEDYLYQCNLGIRDGLYALGADLTYEESGGTHEWGFWDRYIKRVLDWLPSERERGE